MLNFKEFQEYIKSNVKDYLPESYKDADIQFRDVVKNNDVHLTGVMIKRENETVTPNIYINELYEKYSSGMNLDEIVGDIADLRIEHDPPEEAQSISSIFTNYEIVKQRLEIHLCDMELNRDKLKNQVYTGKQIQPALKVTLNGKTLKAGKDYTVTYTDNKNTGLAKATINGTGKYAGTQTVTFKIVPKKAVLKTVKAEKSGTATVTIGKAGGKVSGYAIQVSTDSSFKKVITYRTAKTTYTLKNLSKGKTYYVRVKAFTKVSDKNVYGAASKTIKVKAK